MCQVLGVSRSGYYDWKVRPISELARRRSQILKKIRQSFIGSNRLYGSPKITAELRAMGIITSQKTVARLMKEHGMVSRTVKRYKRTTNSNHNLPVHDNHLNQEFTASSPNEKWVADITYIPTHEGWLYLASVMDLYSRKIIGWQVSNRMTKELTLSALQQAVSRRGICKETLIHHSDRGSQYASKAYQESLDRLGITGSMSRKGNCYDNACIESFHGILKKELVYLNSFKTRGIAQKKLFEYIEFFYNRKRIHSAIGYLSPVVYENKYRNCKLLAS
jgi:putative transposase